MLHVTFVDAIPYRAAVAGLGMMGYVGVVALNRHPAWEPVLIADLDEAARHRASAHVTSATVLDRAEPLADRAVLDAHDIDVVFVMTPPGSHANLAVGALGADRHVVCEKPMARRPDECEEMVAAASAGAARGRIAIIDHQLRYNPARRWIRDRLAAGALGRPLSAQVDASFPELNASPWTWWSSLEAGGGLLNEYGSHMVDLLHWWFGPSDAADGIVRTLVPQRCDTAGTFRPVDSDDATSFRLTWEKGPYADISLSAAPAALERTIRIHTDEMTLTLRQDDSIHVVRRDGQTSVTELAETAPSLIGERGDTYTQPFYRLIDDLACHLDAGQTPSEPTSFSAGAQVIERLHQVRNSATTEGHETG